MVKEVKLMIKIIWEQNLCFSFIHYFTFSYNDSMIKNCLQLNYSIFLTEFE